MDDETRTCFFCGHFDPFFVNDADETKGFKLLPVDNGQCRRSPPVLKDANKNKDTGYMEYYFGWPTVTAGQWCGEWHRATEEEFGRRQEAGTQAPSLRPEDQNRRHGRRDQSG